VLVLVEDVEHAAAVDFALGHPDAAVGMSVVDADRGDVISSDVCRLWTDTVRSAARRGVAEVWRAGVFSGREGWSLGEMWPEERVRRPAVDRVEHDGGPYARCR